MKKLILIMSKALPPEIANHQLARYAAKSLSKYIVIGVSCLTFAASAPAKLGETLPELIKRFGKSYTVEPVQTGKNYKFRSEKVSVDVVVADNISVSETYFSDHPLTASEEPPNDIVQGVLRTNVPKAKWVEIEAAPYRADYAIRSSDNRYIALLRYRGPQPEGATWTMTVARRENIPAAVAALPTSAAPSKSPVANINESPTQAASIAVASTPAASPTRAPETALATPAASPAPAPLSAEDQAFADRGGYWITEDTLAGRSKEDLKQMMSMALSNDTEAEIRMEAEGRGRLLKQGERVQLQDASMFSGMATVRPVGETKSWWIYSGHISKTPAMTHEQELSAVQATTQGIVQQPLTGSLSALKLFVGQPLAVWKKAYGSGKPSVNNPNGYIFNAGRFLIVVFFDEKSGLGNEVQVSEAKGQAPLTVKEATQIANSIGLSKPPVKDAEDPKRLNWNKEGDPLFAHFSTDQDDLTFTIIAKP